MQNLSSELEGDESQTLYTEIMSLFLIVQRKFCPNIKSIKIKIQFSIFSLNTQQNIKPIELKTVCILHLTIRSLQLWLCETACELRAKMLTLFH